MLILWNQEILHGGLEKQVEFKQKEMERKQGISGAEPARAEFRGSEKDVPLASAGWIKHGKKPLFK